MCHVLVNLRGEQMQTNYDFDKQFKFKFVISDTPEADVLNLTKVQVPKLWSYPMDDWFLANFLDFLEPLHHPW